MNVLLVDDQPLILSALSNIIQTIDAGTSVRTAETPEAAFDLLAADGAVDLVLIDLLLGRGVDGFAVLAELRARYPALPVVVVSAIERLTDMVRVIDMGAMGFVPKRSPQRELVEALTLVLGGGVYIPPALLGLARTPGVNLAAAAAAADALASQQTARWRIASVGSATAPGGAAVLLPMVDAAARLGPDGPGPGLGTPAATRAGMAALGLTPRQSDVLTLLLKGLPNKLIARELKLSVDTVKDHVAAVLRTLGVGSRTQAVVVVSRLTQPGPGGGAAGPP
jgi:DNA-binding NarL/FixJ family response regulator